MRPRQVHFAESGLAVVSGSDHGTVYVFETRTCELLQKLEMGVPQWVVGSAVGISRLEWNQADEPVQTADIDGVPVIFAALTRKDEQWEEIFVWKRAHDHSIGWNKVGTFVKVLVVLGCLAFIYQNLGGYIKAWIGPRVAAFIKAGPELVGHEVGNDVIAL